jgi:hypothetical protein
MRHNSLVKTDNDDNARRFSGRPRVLLTHDLGREPHFKAFHIA